MYKNWIQKLSCARGPNKKITFGCFNWWDAPLRNLLEWRLRGLLVIIAGEMLRKCIAWFIEILNWRVFEGVVYRYGIIASLVGFKHVHVLVIFELGPYEISLLLLGGCLEDGPPPAVPEKLLDQRAVIPSSDVDLVDGLLLGVLDENIALVVDPEVEISHLEHLSLEYLFLLRTVIVSEFKGDTERVV